MSRHLIPLALTSLALLLAAQPPKPKPAYRERDAALKLFAEEFVAITPGQGKFPAEFTMGSGGDAPKEEKPAHTVRPARPFAMAKNEVTQELYQGVMGKNPSKWTGPRNSVEMMSWDEANDFCRKATELMRKAKQIGDDEEVRLPTEAEWEYACRAGTTTPYSFADAADIKAHAWYNANSKGEDPPVGVKKPNPWGLFDMHGYLWEWVADSWHDDYTGAPADGSARADRDAKRRVLRSGAWNEPAEKCRSASRMPSAADTRSDAIGFRCVKAKVK